MTREQARKLFGDEGRKAWTEAAKDGLANWMIKLLFQWHAGQCDLYYYQFPRSLTERYRDGMFCYTAAQRLEQELIRIGENTNYVISERCTD